ncbi:hypothetical protein [Stenotrophomonas sp. ZAC14D2_NAIMI4_7]|uniref:hypothetical protein n=1 Tax=Stenotrophomonas sp. ZAC14D2_NAIMI4_7 TaxID=2072405 RepID=UPI0018FFFA14|nr:hypothetical protein [Stenotrophomonas sp. ZAC14D2_NAIMI4_7]
MSVLLRRSIARVLAVASLLAGGTAQGHWIQEQQRWAVSPFDTTGTSNLPPIDALPPDPEPQPEPEPEPQPDPGPDVPPDPPDNEGGVGGDGETQPSARCVELLASRPSACPNPIPLPQGPYYGEESIPGSTVFHSSSIRMAIGFARKNAPWNGVTIEPHESARSFLEAALQEQTDNFSSGMSLAEANSKFRTHLALACDLQVGAANANRNSITPTKPEEFCFEMLKAFDSEANDEKNFIMWFAEYSRLTGIPLDAYVPYGIVGMEDAKNSIGEKWRRVSEDSTCSHWWREFSDNVCEVPR